MAKTSVSDVSDQVQEMWSDLFQEELLESTILPTLVNKDYQGDIMMKGDTVKISQINRPTAERKTIGAGADTFNPEKLSTQQVEIVADTRIVASFEFSDLVEIQSQIGDQDSAIRRALTEAMNIELNNFLYEFVAPSASLPTHVLTSVTDFNAAQVNTIRKLASQAKWRRDMGWWILADPQYYSDLLNDTTVTSRDFGADDTPVIGGQIGLNRFGFRILEDNSAGLISLSGSTDDAAIAFHPDFLGMVMQRQPTFKVSDLHSNKEFGFVISVDMIVGAKLLNDGDVKHISIINS